MKPMYKEYMKALEDIFGQTLTSEGEIAAKDFYDNWDYFRNKISIGEIRINVDMLLLKHRHKQYNNSSVLKGFSIMIALLGIIFIFINWKIGLGIITLSIIFNFISKSVNFNTGKNLVDDIVKNVNTSNLHNGMYKMIALYISGIIQLAEQDNKVAWPAYPSNLKTNGNMKIRKMHYNKQD